MGSLLLTLGVAYAVWLAVLYLMQGTMLYPGTSRGDGGEGGARHGYEPIALSVPPGQAWFLPPTAARPAPVVAFTHGNGELIDDWFASLRHYQTLGVGVLLVEYPGYGGTEGDPSEASIGAAMVAAYDAVVARDDVDGARFVVHGRSLGGGAACALATKRPVAGIIVESAFTSVPDMAARYLAPSFLIRDRFDNEAVLTDYRGPVLVMHGRTDGVIPFSHGEKLARAAPRATFLPRDCGHNDCPRDADYWAAIETLLDEL